MDQYNIFRSHGSLFYFQDFSFVDNCENIMKIKK